MKLERYPLVRRSLGVKNYHENLKTIAGLCGIEQNLTSYVSRHSFAKNAMLSDVPVNAISAMLGHSSLKTMEIYLKSLPGNILMTITAGY